MVTKILVGEPYRSVAFASCYVYSPGARGAVAARSRALCNSLKGGDTDFLRRYAARVRLEVAGQPRLAEFFGPGTVLVPVPGSSPHAHGAIWIAEHLASELVRAGLGSLVWIALTRLSPVRKSSSAPPGLRTTVARHYESFAVEGGVREPGMDLDILLVDDVISKGRTLLAAASRLREAHPRARIRCFALLRTMGFAAELHSVIQPCVGEIRWVRGDARRFP